jgi:hypothetical protein
MNSALKMPIEMPKAPLVPGRAEPDSMNNVHYSDTISEQFNNILDQRARIMNMNQQTNTAEQFQVQYPNLVPTELQKSVLTIPAVNQVPEYIQQNNPQMTAPQVQIVRRNLTVAELGAVFIFAIFAVGAVQAVWSFVPKPIVSVEWRR